MKKELLIRQKSAVVTFRGRQVRTPTVISMTESEFEAFKLQLRAKNITDYVFGKEEKVEDASIVENNLDEPIIEDLTAGDLINRLASEGE